VLVPTGREIAQYEHFRKDLAVASAALSRSPGARESRTDGAKDTVRSG